MRLEQKIYNLAKKITKLEPHVAVNFTPYGEDLRMYLFRGKDILSPVIILEDMTNMTIKQILAEIQIKLEEWHETTESTT